MYQGQLPLTNEHHIVDYYKPSYQGTLLAGVDEAGRGPLAGPVWAAAVILSPNKPIIGLNDSKQLTEKQREKLFNSIIEQALCVRAAKASVDEIDRLNILQASLLAMQRAVAHLNIQPEYVLVDGNRLPNWSYESIAVAKGDQRHPAIAAASIIAKVTRDREMIQLDAIYEGYGFAQHKGYPTAQHRQILQAKGITPIHRKTFAPVKQVIDSNY